MSPFPKNKWLWVPYIIWGSLVVFGEIILGNLAYKWFIQELHTCGIEEPEMMASLISVGIPLALVTLGFIGIYKFTQKAIQVEVKQYKDNSLINNLLPTKEINPSKDLTPVQIFKQYLDERILKGKTLWFDKDITSQKCAEWYYKTHKGVETAIGPEEVENSFHYGNFYPPNSDKEYLRTKLSQCFDEAQQVRDWVTAPRILPGFDVRDLDEFR